jgi:antitoxin ParD1/3/4
MPGSTTAGFDLGGGTDVSNLWGEIVRAGLRLLEDEENLRQIRHRELKAAIQEGIDSEDAGSVENVVARNRARRGKSKTPKK